MSIKAVRDLTGPDSVVELVPGGVRVDGELAEPTDAWDLKAAMRGRNKMTGRQLRELHLGDFQAGFESCKGERGIGVVVSTFGSDLKALINWQPPFYRVDGLCMDLVEVGGIYEAYETRNGFIILDHRNPIRDFPLDDVSVPKNANWILEQVKEWKVEGQVKQ